MPELEIPQTCLVLLVGASAAGKSTFAARHFDQFEVVSSDFCRGLVSGDPLDQSATADAFEALEGIVGIRLRRGLLTVVDATNVQAAARKSLIALARAHDVLPVGIVLDLPESVCLARDSARERSLGGRVIARQIGDLRRGVKGLGREGLRQVHTLRTEDEVATARIVRVPLLNDRRGDAGPFDVVGDVHGCLDELLELLERLGYAVTRDEAERPVDAAHPAGRRLVFLGDLVDRGPDSVGVLRLAMGMTAAGHAIAVTGNHEARLVRALGRGSKVEPTHGLAGTLAALAEAGPEFTARARQWAYDLVAHLVFDGGRLVVAHAGLKEAYHGRASGRVRAFALYGDTTGESDEYGLPVRHPWAEEYRGRAKVIYGHTPVLETRWVNNTLCLDTGCAFGGKLSALRYPENEIVQVAARRVYSEPIRPLGSGSGVAPASGLARAGDQAPDADPAAAHSRDAGAAPGGWALADGAGGLLDAGDVLGKRVIETRWMGRVSVQAEQAAAAFEVMSRFSAAPDRIAYLPPTMAPVGASRLDGFLEHPREAFAYFADFGVVEVICEEKHMGSRAVAWVRAPGAVGPESLHTRTGRPFFDSELEAEALSRIRAAIGAAGLWDELGAEWLLLDAELMPWSLKAEGLLEDQYRPVAAGAQAMYGAALEALADGIERGLDLTELRDRTARRAENAAAFGRVLERYAWETTGLAGVRLAPFQVLAAGHGGGGEPLYARPHVWHLAMADRLAAADPEFFQVTRRILVRPGDSGSQADGVVWWEKLTAAGGEGMVVKPAAAPVRLAKGLVQPGLKVRGREYLRITYGPDYLDQLDSLRNRSLGRKRSLALREYALGLEAVDRLAAGEPLWRRHEAVCAVLALESEPVDPRL
ncbi:MAG: AAA family ATPase [Bifidobacteriaceae bacterium]|jgi:protein phosphatase|nr:AAA family ATPase [Bifidobacteriaceae bacterium]